MININEIDIKIVKIIAGEAELHYIKYTKNDTEYHIRYRYADSYIENDKHYCDKCGSVYSTNKCPECNGDDDNILNYKYIADMIYDSINDDMIVIIQLWDGTEYKLKPPTVEQYQ